MSIIPPGLSRHLQFYLSGPLPCPYLPNRVERKLFTRLGEHGDYDSNADADINGALTRAGFRRSHDIVYRPACSDCSACVPVRIPVAQFKPSRNLRRIAKRNSDLRLEVTAAMPGDELFDLFMRYQSVRHPDSDMARMSFEDFRHMLAEGASTTFLYQLRDERSILRGVMLADHVGDGASAVYSFFDPMMPQRSIGIQLILTLIAEMQTRGFGYVYLGYWINAARKMAYKARFAPMQALGPQGWDWLQKDPASD